MIFSILVIACFVLMTVLLVLSLVRFPSDALSIDPNKNKKEADLNKYLDNAFCLKLLKPLLFPFLLLVLMGIFVAVDNVPNEGDYIPPWIGGTFGFGLSLGWLPIAALFAVVRVKSGIHVIGRWGKVHTHTFFKVVNGVQCGIAFVLSAIYFTAFFLFAITLTGIIP